MHGMRDWNLMQRNLNEYILTPTHGALKGLLLFVGFLYKSRFTSWTCELYEKALVLLHIRGSQRRDGGDPVRANTRCLLLSHLLDLTVKRHV